MADEAESPEVELTELILMLDKSMLSRRPETSASQRNTFMTPLNKQLRPG
ncbi:MAG: hypothetical protein IIC71_13100 [Acidobacteria bacterium]|nr:hypothetical protein [Acidobacteriota bacterium]